MKIKICKQVFASITAVISFVVFSGAFAEGVSKISSDVVADDGRAVDFYVATTGSDEAGGSEEEPFATVQTAIAAADAAIANGAARAVVHVAVGTYVGSGYRLQSAIEIVGAGKDLTVIDGNRTFRVFELLSPGAAIKNLTVSNAVFTAAEQTGAGIYMENGLIEDCVISSCGDFMYDKTSGGGIYASGGRIARSVFTGCKVHMKWSGNVGYGSALYLSNGAICENSLFTGNAAPPCYNWNTANRRGGVVYLTDEGTALVNCTVVDNRITDGKGDNPSCFAGIVQKYKAMVVNCIAYKNVPNADFVVSHGDVFAGGDTSGNNWANFFINSAWDTTIKSTTPSSITVDEKYFNDYPSADYTPSIDGPFFNGGSDEKYETYAVSVTDLANVMRRQGDAIDIGCYETALSTQSLNVYADSYGVVLGTPSRISVIAAEDGGNSLYKWDFGDGSAETTPEKSVEHVYASAGLYNISVQVSSNGGETWSEAFSPNSAIVVAPEKIYVDAANENPVFPYDTPAKAAATLADAFGALTNTFQATLGMAVVDGVEINIAPGTYTGSGYAIAGAITVFGAGKENTVVDGNGGFRVFSLLSPGAAIKNLTVSNAVFTAAEQTGAGIYMENGLIEDCVISSCGDFMYEKTSGGGIYASGGRIARTVFTGCKVHMKWTRDIGYGSALYLSNGAICENSLFTGNAAVPCYTFDSKHYRGGVVHLTGTGTVFVNCTVVDNRITDGKGDTPCNYAGIVQKNSAKAVNCVSYMNVPDADFVTSETIYGDVYAADANECFVNSLWGTAISQTPSPDAVSDAAFKNFAKKDFRPTGNGVLVNGGTTWTDYRSYGAESESDLAGKNRLNGQYLDIGCYETESGFSVILR